MAESEIKHPSVRRWLVAVLTVILIQGVLTIFALPSLLQGELVDTDTYMHLVRARELWQGEAFFEPVIDRSNTPFGETQHWTRPYDVALIALALPFSARGIDSALNIAALLAGPIMLVVFLVAFEWATRPLRRSRDWPFVLVLAASLPAVLAYAAVGRADHHIVLLVLMTFAIGSLVRIQEEPEPSVNDLRLGALLAAGLWVSTEFLVVIAIALGSLAVVWIQNGKPTERKVMRVALAWLVGMTLAVGVERGPNWATVEYDRISVVHLALGLAACVALAAAGKLASARQRVGRMVALGVTGAAALLAVWALFPRVLGGPWAAIDPQVSEIWLDRVAELQPMFPTSLNGIGLATIYLGAPIAGLLLGVWAVARRTNPWPFAAMPVLAGCAVFIGLALRYSRFAPHAEVFGAIPLLWGVDQVLLNAERRRAAGRIAIRIGVVAFASIGFLIVGSFLSGLGEIEDSNGEADSCNLRELSVFLNDRSQITRPITILANIDFGSELLYRTSHRVVGTPIRQQDAILDTYNALTSTNPADARRIISVREVDHLVLCPSRDGYLFGDPPPPGSLDDRLLSGNTPEWLSAIRLPSNLSGFRMFEVRTAD